jgi:hypothetical protein
VVPVNKKHECPLFGLQCPLFFFGLTGIVRILKQHIWRLQVFIGHYDLTALGRRGKPFTKQINLFSVFSNDSLCRTDPIVSWLDGKSRRVRPVVRRAHTDVACYRVERNANDSDMLADSRICSHVDAYNGVPGTK